MPKVTGPLFSVDAHGALAKALTYQRRPGGASVYGYKKPKIPLTVSQHNQREKIRWCVESWQSFSDVVKDEWEEKAKGQGQSGYSYFIKQTVGYVYDPDVVLFLPLWMTELSGSSFTSRDSYGQACVVYGPTWFAQGRSFDGNDDYFSCGSAASLDDLTAWTWEAWLYAKAGTASRIVNKTAKILYFHEAKLRGFLYASTPGNSRDASAFPLNQWVNVNVTYDDAGDRLIRLYKNRVEVTYDIQVAPVGALTSDAAENLILGTIEGYTDDFNGYIGEVRVTKRVLSLVEMEHNYLVTKWRYV